MTYLSENIVYSLLLISVVDMINIEVACEAVTLSGNAALRY